MGPSSGGDDHFDQARERDPDHRTPPHRDLHKNYSEAGAVDVLGSTRGCRVLTAPTTPSANEVAPPGDDTRMRLIGAANLANAAPYFDRCHTLATIDDGVGLNNQEQRGPLLLCHITSRGRPLGTPRPLQLRMHTTRHSRAATTPTRLSNNASAGPRTQTRRFRSSMRTPPLRAATRTAPDSASVPPLRGQQGGRRRQSAGMRRWSCSWRAAGLSKGLRSRPGLPLRRVCGWRPLWAGGTYPATFDDCHAWRLNGG